MSAMGTTRSPAVETLHAQWERRGFWQVSGLSLFLIFTAYLPIPVVLAWYLLNDLGKLEGPMPQGLMIGAGLVAALAAGFFLLLFYAAFGSYRYTPTDDGLVVLTILGRRRFRWDQVRSAILSQYRDSFMIQLRLGPLRLGYLFLNDFRRPRSFLVALQAVLPVAIKGLEYHWDAIRDP